MCGRKCRIFILMMHALHVVVKILCNTMHALVSSSDGAFSILRANPSSVTTTAMADDSDRMAERLYLCMPDRLPEEFTYFEIGKALIPLLAGAPADTLF